MTSQTATLVEHEIGSHGSVSVRGFDGSVDIRATAGSTVRLRGNGARALEDDYRIVRDPGGLRVEAVGLDRFGPRWFRFDRTQGLDLEVPRGATVRIETASGSVHADGLQGDQRYQTVSGDLRLTGAGGRMVVDGVSGDVVVRASTRLDLEVRVVSADLEATAPEFGQVRVKTTSGDLRLDGALAEGTDHTIETISGDTTIAPAGPIQVDGRTVSGELRTSLPHVSDGRPGRRTIRVGDGGAHVSFRSISGGLTVVGPGQAAAARPGTVPTPPPEPPASPARREVPDRPSSDSIRADPAGSPDDAARLTILRDLEAGRIDVAEAERRLAGIDRPLHEAASRPEAETPSPTGAAATEPIPDPIDEEDRGDD